MAAAIYGCQICRGMLCTAWASTWALQMAMPVCLLQLVQAGGCSSMKAAWTPLPDPEPRPWDDLAAQHRMLVRQIGLKALGLLLNGPA